MTPRANPWHVGPLLDMGAYHFSWVWALLPLLFFGNEHPVDYVAVFMVVMIANFAHRHVTLPYVYLDKQVFLQYPLRFLVFPGFMLAAFVASPFLWRTTLRPFQWSALEVTVAGAAILVALQLFWVSQSAYRLSWRGMGVAVAPATLLGLVGWQAPDAGVAPTAWTWLLVLGFLSTVVGFSARDREGRPQARWRRLVAPGLILVAAGGLLILEDANAGIWPTGGRGFALKTIVSTSAFVAVLWNLWHIHMQKFGIMRLYNAKAAKAGDPEVPRWVDWWMVFGWLPFYLVYLGPANRNLLLENGPTIQDNTMPLIDGIENVQPWLLPPAIAIIAVSLGLFLYHEWRAHRFRNAPRLSLAAGMTLLSASFLVFHPVKVALGYVFTHAVEYTVFVWAFNRTRYGQPLAHRPWLGRLLTRPWLAYGGFLVAVALVYGFCAFYGRYIHPDAETVRVAGTSLRRWIFYWGIFQSMMHFYFDGFLWKMRLPVYRDGIHGASTAS